MFKSLTILNETAKFLFANVLTRICLHLELCLPDGGIYPVVYRLPKERLKPVLAGCVSLVIVLPSFVKVNYERTAISRNQFSVTWTRLTLSVGQSLTLYILKNFDS